MHPLATILVFLTLAVFGDAVPSNIDTTRLVQPTKGEPLGTILGISWVSIAYFFAAMSGSALVLLILMQTVSTWGWWRLKGQGEKPAMVRTWVCFHFLHSGSVNQACSLIKIFALYPLLTHANHDTLTAWMGHTRRIRQEASQARPPSPQQAILLLEVNKGKLHLALVGPRQQRKKPLLRPSRAISSTLHPKLSTKPPTRGHTIAHGERQLARRS
jgi:hypothetical protein